jgi:hypothetical protein
VIGTIVAVGSSSPIQIALAAPHGLATGATILLTGAPDGFGCNGFWQVTVTGPTSLQLNNSQAGTGGTGPNLGSVYSTFSAPFTADGIGPAYSADPGDISEAVTSNAGVYVTNFAGCTGANYESNTAYAQRCRLSRSALSPNVPSAAYEYFALSAYTLLKADGFTLRSGPITRAKVTTDPLTGSVYTCVAPETPQSTTQGAQVTFGGTNLAVTGASNASPILITCPNHGLTDGELVVVQGVLGNVGANGTWNIIADDANHFWLLGSSGTGTYTGGGQVDGGPLGLVDDVIQANCVPDGAPTAYTVSGLAQTLAIAASVSVPAAQLAAYRANVQTILSAYVNAAPIGGYELPDNGGWGLSLDTVIGLLWQAGSINGAQSYVQSVSGVTINGSAEDFQYSSSLLGRGVGVLSPEPDMTLTGV